MIRTNVIHLHHLHIQWMQKNWPHRHHQVERPSPQEHALNRGAESFHLVRLIYFNFNFIRLCPLLADYRKPFLFFFSFQIHCINSVTKYDYACMRLPRIWFVVLYNFKKKKKKYEYDQLTTKYHQIQFIKSFWYRDSKLATFSKSYGKASPQFVESIQMHKMQNYWGCHVLRLDVN